MPVLFLSLNGMDLLTLYIIFNQFAGHVVVVDPIVPVTLVGTEQPILIEDEASIIHTAAHQCRLGGDMSATGYVLSYC